MKPFARIAISLLIFSVFQSVAESCRYNVRDAGFVDLNDAHYSLYFYHDKNISTEQVETFRQISFAALLDSNIEVELIDIEEGEERSSSVYPGMKEVQSYPAAVLVSPEKKSTLIPFLTEADTFQESVWSSMNIVVSSPVREEIKSNIIQAYGVVLLIHGKDNDENQKAHNAVSTAIEEIAKVMSRMPKPLEYPPHMIEISQDQFPQEKILLWSLGLDSQNIQDPHVAVLHGRGRQIGPVLKGHEITRNSVYHTLSVIGQSCECGLDRQWMQGTMLPLIWGQKEQAKVVDALGFDAESPGVKMEISQILSMGSSRPLFGQTANSMGNILDGYSEITLDFGEQAESTDVNTTIQTTSVSLDSPLQNEPKPEVPHPSTTVVQSVIYVMIVLFAFVLAGSGWIWLRSRRTQ